MKKDFGLCAGRHEMPQVREYIFPNELDPLNIKGMEMQAREKLAGVSELTLYVTGLTVALISVVNVCRELQIKVTLMHYNKETGDYYPQEVK